MAAKYSHCFSFHLCLLLLIIIQCHGEIGFGSARSNSRRFGVQSPGNECHFEKLSTMEPNTSDKSIAGTTEYYDPINNQLRCTGVFAFRQTILSRGLAVPAYSSAPLIIYVSQGSGIMGVVIPGCPETYRSPSSRDQYQRIHTFRKGDIIVIPAGVVYWFYNNGKTPVVAVGILHTSNSINQLDWNARQFLLAGGQSQKTNILRAFDAGLLANALGVKKESIEKLQKEQSSRIVYVEKGFEVFGSEMEEEEEEEEEGLLNGVEQSLCTTRFRENIGKPSRVDIYSQTGGRLTNLDGNKLPILRRVKLSAQKGVLEKNAILIPYWTINAHSVMYVTKGSAKVQIVSDGGRRVFDGEVREGQMLVVPQYFAAVVQAGGGESFEWVAFFTDDDVVVSRMIGKGSYFRGVPLDVVVYSYPGISREEARDVKYTNEDLVAFITPSSSGQQRKEDA